MLKGGRHDELGLISASLVGLDLEPLVLEEPSERRQRLIALATGQVGGADLVGGPDGFGMSGDTPQEIVCKAATPRFRLVSSAGAGMP